MCGGLPGTGHLIKQQSALGHDVRSNHRHCKGLSTSTHPCTQAHAHTRAYAHTHTHIRIHTYTYTHMHMYTYIHAHTPAAVSVKSGGLC